ncbi:MAG: hypothetical protein JO246_06685, partial [Frankiaceae bacterium]|nr:hypothetical protein [Frankiaceae bacterium]
MPSPSTHVRRRTVAIAVAALAGTASVGLPSAAAHPSKHVRPVAAHSRYLALGDSISFGYRESNSNPAPDFSKPKQFVGFPEDVAKNLGLRLTNAACPGETTVSFINATKQSNGCENSYQPGTGMVAGGYRTAHPLHTKYKSATQSQLQFAKAFLKKYPKTSLVTLMIGANDGFLCLAKTTDQCQGPGEFAKVQAQITKHVKRILKGLRGKAHYKGQLVIVSYYATDYTDFYSTYESQGLNKALTDAAKGFHATIADGYGQFEKAAMQANGNTCTAQLLTALTGPDEGTCGVHPSLT